MPGPLTGVRVLELARILAGPWAGQILADLGADVIKAERSGAGDDTRGWGPPFVPGTGGAHLGAAYFHATNRGKRSIELDFESEHGRRIVRKLAALTNRTLLQRSIQMLYVQALLLGHHPLNAKEMGLLNEGLLGLIEWGVQVEERGK